MRERILRAVGQLRGRDFEIVDGLAHVRSGHEDALKAEAVRIVSTEDTESRGYASLIGEVMGETMPSASGVKDIIGDCGEDYAISVWFDERDEQVWFAPHLVEPA